MSFLPKEDIKHCFIACDEQKKESGLCDCDKRVKNSIISDWTLTDHLIYNNADTKLKSLEAAKTKVIAKN